MIDALFGSKTRVKLLHLFLNNPGKSFYVREITRLIDEQINSVRRELANMVEVGIISSENSENRLYYKVNQRYQYYVPFRAIFADERVESKSMETSSNEQWIEDVKTLSGVKAAVAAGVLVDGSKSPVDLLIIGRPAQAKLKKLITQIETDEGREINYTVLSHDDFYYRLSVRDKFISEILHNQHKVLVDNDDALRQVEEE